MTLQDMHNWIVHLRLRFQFFLSPIFLWGFLIAESRIDRAFIFGYMAFHVFGYAGGTAFNSYYDRDSGPIGGLEHPPPIPRGLLPFSIVWQLIGFAIALAINLPFAAIYTIMFWMSVAYSHPRTRFKGKPLPALATVALGQGIFAYLGGWACARGELISVLSIPGLLGVFASTLIVVGYYPLTEIYQIDEDQQRGDTTLAVWLGPANSFRFAMVFLLLGGVAALILIINRYRVVEALLLTMFLVGALLVIWRWSHEFDKSDVARNFLVSMRLYATTSLCFIAWIGLHLLADLFLR